MPSPGGTRSLFPALLHTSNTPQQVRAAAPATPNYPRVESRAVAELLWLALRLPNLALDALADAAADVSPIAVIDEEGGSCAVSVANVAAMDLGIQPGLSLNAAYALVPGLQTVARDEALEQARLRRLAAWAGQFTSTVSVAAPDALLLEIQGSLKLFGGLTRLLDVLTDGLRDLGVAHHLAVAPTPLSALWFARSATPRVVTATETLADALGRLPLAVTGWSHKLLVTLDSMGVRQIGDCLRLPRDGFSRRFGHAPLADLDRALGKRADPRVAVELPPTFDAALELLAETEKLPRIEAVAGRLLDELAGFLRGRQMALETFVLCLEHQDVSPTRVTLGLAALTRDVARLKSVLHERLERVTLPAPVIGVGLEARRLIALAGCDGDLFSRSVSGYDWPQLVERLRARLGAASVHGLCLVPEHRPEAAWRYVEPGMRGELFAVRQRPLWMLSAPVRLAVREGRPYCDGPLRFISGPERIETGWWDGKDVARDYYVAVTVEGVHLWVYRRRRAPRDWYLHGTFA